MPANYEHCAREADDDEFDDDDEVEDTDGDALDW